MGNYREELLHFRSYVPELHPKLNSAEIRIILQGIKTLDHLLFLKEEWIGDQVKEYRDKAAGSYICFDTQTKSNKPLPVAYAILEHRRLETCYFSRVGVRSGYRGHGLQNLFIKMAEVDAVKLGYKEIVTDTNFNNYHAMNNFIQSGYLTYKPSTNWGLETSVYWRKLL